MKISIKTIFLMAALALPGCSPENEDTNPDPLSDQEHVVIVPASADGKSTLTGLDGRSGAVKWTMPFSGDLTLGTNELYINQRAYNAIEKYSDTLALYSAPSQSKNLSSIDPVMGTVVGEVYNLLKPNFHLSCCHELQVNQLIGVEAGTAFMGLMFRGPFSGGLPTAQKFTVYATDVKTGAVKWTTDIPSNEIPAFDDLANAMRVKDGKIYIAGTRYSYILDAGNGTKLQSFPIGKLIELSGGIFYKADYDKVSAVDAGSGTLKWQFTRDNASFVQPAVSNGIAFTATADGKLYAFDAQSGSKKWEVQFANTNNGAFHTLQASNDMLYGTFMNGKIYAIDASNGSVKWDAQLDLNAYVSPWDFQIRGNYIYAWDLVNRVVALDRTTGQKIWEKSIPGAFQGSHPLIFTKGD